MNTKKFIICLLFLIVNLFDLGSDFDDYQKLEIQNVSSITREDLPSEFSDEAFKTVDEFIRKTRDLNFEFVIYFDYITGEILKCVKGASNNVKMVFEDDEFDGYHVASIHNHPKDLLSPPSSKNFGIFIRAFEDYELVAGFNSFWILKAKGVHQTLFYETNIMSDSISDACLDYCSSRYSDDKIIGKMHDIRYGTELLKYINKKNINDIQLMKKEYVAMSINLNTAEYHCKRRPTHEEIELARKRVADPNILTGKDKLYAMYKMIGVDVDYDRIFED